MSNGARIGIIAAIAVVAFGAAFLLSGGDDSPPEDPSTDLAAGGSQTSTTQVEDAEEGESGEEDPCRVSDPVPVEETGYQLDVATEPDPPTPSGTTLAVTVQRDGEPVEGAVVCVRADMAGMSHEGVNAQVEEVGDGRYELADLNFSMRGRWGGRVVVVEPGQPGTSMPVSFNVQ